MKRQAISKSHIQLFFFFTYQAFFPTSVCGGMSLWSLLSSPWGWWFCLLTIKMPSFVTCLFKIFAFVIIVLSVSSCWFDRALYIFWICILYHRSVLHISFPSLGCLFTLNDIKHLGTRRELQADRRLGWTHYLSLNPRTMPASDFCPVREENSSCPSH